MGREVNDLTGSLPLSLSPQSKSYVCSSQGNLLSFTVDFASGFSCSQGNSKVETLPAGGQLFLITAFQFATSLSN